MFGTRHLSNNTELFTSITLKETVQLTIFSGPITHTCTYTHLNTFWGEVRSELESRKKGVFPIKHHKHVPYGANSTFYFVSAHA